MTTAQLPSTSAAKTACAKSASVEISSSSNLGLGWPLLRYQAILLSPAEAEIAAVQEQAELKTVYFEYDRWDLRDEARRALRGNAKHLQEYPGWGELTVAGHCDERGSDEYNVALGDRRAEAVKRYLVDLGIPSSRIRTVSFGESRPAVRGEGEAAWSRNRRAEMSLGTQHASH